MLAGLIFLAPFLIQVPIVVVWAVGNLLSLLLLPTAWIVVGVGASMAVGNGVGSLLSFILLHRRFGSLDGRTVLSAHLRMVIAAAVGGAVAFSVTWSLHAALGESRLTSMAAAGLGGVALLGVYVLVLRRLRVKELDDALVPLTAYRDPGNDNPPLRRFWSLLKSGYVEPSPSPEG